MLDEVELLLVEVSVLEVDVSVLEVDVSVLEVDEVLVVDVVVGPVGSSSQSPAVRSMNANVIPKKPLK